MAREGIKIADESALRAMEIWAGAECTVNRVGDVFRDQLRLTGHHDRYEDLDFLTALGVSALRFPVLWERVAPADPDEQDWRWSDLRLERLRQLRIRPIVGLLHHGSGPSYTSLIDQSFASGLARHALLAARRYPWVREWTPVNEPLTTARFSTLYGHWYPHARDERLFWTALLNQVTAVQLSMQAIRTIIPDAQLIQTEDLGRTYSTAALVEQAGFDNVRRWMTWDLLCGRVTPHHELWQRICSFRLEPALRSLLEEPCPPDVVGINHYLTSDRFLDHRLQRYPRGVQGGNGSQSYADVEAVRVLHPPSAGLSGAISEAWNRYHLPLVITEVHNGCTREEQVRWLREGYETALRSRSKGVDLRAVTAWALFGSQGWNTLLTETGHYEAGVYDSRGQHPRATAVAASLKVLSASGNLPPYGAQAGWWKRDQRLLHPVVGRPASAREFTFATNAIPQQPILILGATGTLGRALASVCQHRNLHCRLIGRNELDLADATRIAPALDRYRPWAVINAAGWVRVDDAESSRQKCISANAVGASALSEACQRRGIPTVNFSSDLVFGSDNQRTYHESDIPAPLNIYGQSKWRMEREILAMDGEHLIVRTAAFFSPRDQSNFATDMVRSLRAAKPFPAAEDCIVTPTYVPDLCLAVLDLLLDGELGIWHLSNEEALSWLEFATRLAQACRLDESLIEPVPAAKLGWKAARPRNSALFSEKGATMPSLSSAIQRFADELS